METEQLPMSSMPDVYLSGWLCVEIILYEAFLFFFFFLIYYNLKKQAL